MRYLFTKLRMFCYNIIVTENTIPLKITGSKLCIFHCLITSSHRITFKSKITWKHCLYWCFVYMEWTTFYFKLIKMSILWELSPVFIKQIYYFISIKTKAILIFLIYQYIQDMKNMIMIQKNTFCKIKKNPFQIRRNKLSTFFTLLC